MSREEFNALAAQGCNRIPLVREVLADLDTPVGTYMKLCNKPGTWLFESVLGGEKWGRYSFIGLPARRIYRFRGKTLETVEEGMVIDSKDCADPLAEVRAIQRQFKVPEIDGLPRFSGGLVGYFGYEVIADIEPRFAEILASKPDPLGNPDIVLMLTEELVAFDNLRGSLSIVVYADPSLEGAWERACERVEEVQRQLSNTLPRPMEASVPHELEFVSTFGIDEFQQAVERIRGYIRAGDIMQAVLSQRLKAPFRASALELYRALRRLNPSPYMYYVHLDDFQIVGSSPEILVRLEDGEVTVRPIAGTRRRGKDLAEDLALERELLSDPKECAEHLMLIDLGRNDLSRIAKAGTVKLTDKMIVERYSHVMHIVSNVCGQLSPGMDAIDVFRATFPAGTVSGAPKIRAMEIIAELEPLKRGVYSGAVGYLDWRGNMDTAIAIRTVVVQDGALYIQVGAGIVADSDPRKEWQETMDKGRAIFHAASLAERGVANTCY
ncbi:MAG: anthranilate synthase component I [Candidatus Eutrophobiaceae bacterium]